MAERLNEGGQLYIKPNRAGPEILFKDPAIAEFLESVASTTTSTGEFIIPRDALL